MDFSSDRRARYAGWLLIFVGLVTLKRSSRPPVGLDGFFSELIFRLIAVFVRISVCFSVYC